MSKNLSKMMPDAWPLFFRLRKPRSVQLEAMPNLVHGESVLLSSPTASGKTEAVVAPLYQRHVSFRRSRLSVVYVAPTKALVNDLYYRLDGYFGTLSPGLIRRYTGDHHDFDVPEDVFLLLATPEALDSLQLMRPESLNSVRAVVIDEIHLLHGNARGQQLRHVIRRLEKESAKPKNPKDVFQKVGMTATVKDIELVGQMWLGGSFRSAATGETREIDMTCLSVSAEAENDRADLSAEVICNWLDEAVPEKILVFGNTRNSTHALAAALQERLSGTRWPVHWHIGLLSAEERERIEVAMKEERFGLCVATSTLEVGIDIGDIDAIVLADAPASVCAFLQRIGRGNRRSDICKVIALAGSPQEEAVFRSLLQSAIVGRLDDVHEYDRSSVRFQQVLSFAWKGIRDENPLTVKNLESRTGDSGHVVVIDDMLETGSLKKAESALIPSDELMDQGDKRHIHSTIIGGSRTPLVDMVSGEVMAFASGNSIGTGDLYAGGSMKKVEHSVDGSVYLIPKKKQSKSELAVLPTSRGRRRGLSRAVVWGLAEIAGYNPRQWILENSRLTTWGGLEYNQLLAIILDRAGISKIVDVDDYGIILLDGPEKVSTELVQRWADSVARSQDIPVDKASVFCERPRFFRYLSPDLQAQEIRDSIPLTGFFNWLKECEEELKD